MIDFLEFCYFELNGEMCSVLDIFNEIEMFDVKREVVDREKVILVKCKEWYEMELLNLEWNVCDMCEELFVV